MNQHKPDVPLHILTQVLKTAITSPLGILFLQATRSLVGVKEEENWVDVTSLHLTLPHLDPAFNHYRVVQISDFHIGTWVSRRHLEEAVQLVNQQQPDLVAITGDFVTNHPERYANDLVETLSQLDPRDGTVAVLGNHDHWSNPGAIREVLRQAGIVELNNRSIAIHRGNANLYIAGVDDYMDGLDCLEDVLHELPDDGKSAILLAHEPDFADKAAPTGRFDLQISGHSHGGQVRLPLIGSPFLPRYARKYPRGLYQVGGMILYTNRGLGTAEFNLRWNCRPEITVFTLEATKPPGQRKDDRF